MEGLSVNGPKSAAAQPPESKGKGKGNKGALAATSSQGNARGMSGTTTSPNLGTNALQVTNASASEELPPGVRDVAKLRAVYSDARKVLAQMKSAPRVQYDQGDGFDLQCVGSTPAPSTKSRLSRKFSDAIQAISKSMHKVSGQQNVLVVFREAMQSKELQAKLKELKSLDEEGISVGDGAATKWASTVEALKDLISSIFGDSLESAEARQLLDDIIGNVLKAEEMLQGLRNVVKNQSDGILELVGKMSLDEEQLLHILERIQGDADVIRALLSKFVNDEQISKQLMTIIGDLPLDQLRSAKDRFDELKVDAIEKATPASRTSSKQGSMSPTSPGLPRGSFGQTSPGHSVSTQMVFLPDDVNLDTASGFTPRKLGDSRQSSLRKMSAARQMSRKSFDLRASGNVTDSPGGAPFLHRGSFFMSDDNNVVAMVDLQLPIPSAEDANTNDRSADDRPRSRGAYRSGDPSPGPQETPSCFGDVDKPTSSSLTPLRRNRANSQESMDCAVDQVRLELRTDAGGHAMPTNLVLSRNGSQSPIGDPSGADPIQDLADEVMEVRAGAHEPQATALPPIKSSNARVTHEMTQQAGNGATASSIPADSWPSLPVVREDRPSINAGNNEEHWQWKSMRSARAANALTKDSLSRRAAMRAFDPVQPGSIESVLIDRKRVSSLKSGKKRGPSADELAPEPLVPPTTVCCPFGAGKLNRDGRRARDGVVLAKILGLESHGKSWALEDTPRRPPPPASRSTSTLSQSTVTSTHAGTFSQEIHSGRWRMHLVSVNNSFSSPRS